MKDNIILWKVILYIKLNFSVYNILEYNENTRIKISWYSTILY